MTDGGFSIIPHWVIRDSDLDQYEILVYLALLNRANRHGISWPSIATIVKESRSSESTVHRTIKRLETRGIVVVEKRKSPDGRNLSNRYHVAVFDREVPAGGAGQRDRNRTVPAPPAGTPFQGETIPLSDRQVGASSQTPEVDTPEVDTSKKTEVASDDATPWFSFIESTASEKQLTYLRDLYIHYHGEEPNVSWVVAWKSATTEEVSARITDYLRAMPRHDEYEIPDDFDKLSPRGQEFAEAGFIP